MHVNLHLYIYIYINMDGIYMFSLYKIYISRIRHVSPREQAKCHKTLFFMNFISLNLSLVLFTLYDGCMLCCEFFFSVVVN